MVQRILFGLSRILATGVLGVVAATALLLSPWRMGRLLRTVSIPQLKEHRLRTTLSVFGVALGVAVLIAVMILNRSVRESVNATVDDIAGKADMQLRAGSAGFDESVLDQIRALPGIHKLAPVVQQMAVARHSSSRNERLLILGVDLLGDDEHFRSYGSSEIDAIKRDPLEFLNSTTNILISRSLAQRNGYKLHDKLWIAAPAGLTQFEIWGFIDNHGAGRAFGGSVAIMYYPALQAAFERGRNIDHVDIALAPSAKFDAIKTALKRVAGSSFVIERPSAKGERVGKMMAAVNMGLIMASAIALVVGGFLIYNTMSISIVQRRRELAIVRVLGATRRELPSLIALEGALLGTVGSAFGVLLGMVLARGLLRATSEAVSELYLQVALTHVTIDRAALLASFVLGVSAATIAAAIPARQVAAIAPATALRLGFSLAPATLSARMTRADWIACAALVACPLLLLLPPLRDVPVGGFAAIGALLIASSLAFPHVIRSAHGLLTRRGTQVIGLAAHMAVSNLQRELRRASTMGSALMVSVGLAAGIAAFVGSFVSSLVEWAGQSYPGDLIITSASALYSPGSRNIPLSENLGRELAAMPEVELVRRARFSEIVYRDYPVRVASSDVEILAKRAGMMTLEGTREEIIDKLRHGAIAVSENFSRHFGVHRGDRIELGTMRGPSTFEVAGVVVDYTTDIGTLVIDRATYIDAFGDSLVDSYELYLRAGVDPIKVRAALEQRFGKRFQDLFILTSAEFRSEVTKVTTQVFTIMRALDLVALIVAVLGIVNALLASVLERVREIGVLRALGMLRRQVRKSVMIEATLIGTLGMLAGLVLGLGLGHIVLANISLVSTGWHFPYRPAWSAMFGMAVAVIAASAAAGWYPAHQATGLKIADALDYE